jgi:hypothetical protein
LSPPVQKWFFRNFGAVSWRAVGRQNELWTWKHASTEEIEACAPVHLTLYSFQTLGDHPKAAINDHLKTGQR